ncbi:Ribosome biogenesis GTPase A [Babesia microti strain RI]|uniref:Ribosome biogenesis GTPase A n=1 Tax=Babesia microti (strain RI) TaxID=1133968 RepID=A0A1N6LWD1_BABMR|nr:Ribosome biogenesis GTPase A [Babesia microti strain RI]SIO73181.1 Ribosome biogenesis GTPase A [Babesia microti strain RI]|eukprot:XP_012647187.2 Ribosome biogenesis GTPase A [Babesia microti strain RI]
MDVYDKTHELETIIGECIEGKDISCVKIPLAANYPYVLNDTLTPIQIEQKIGGKLSLSKAGFFKSTKPKQLVLSPKPIMAPWPILALAKDMADRQYYEPAVTKSLAKIEFFNAKKTIGIQSVDDDDDDISKAALGCVKIHWFPRYVGRTMEEISEYMKRVDIIVDVRDARLPYVADDDFMLNVYNNIFTHRPSALVFTHADLASKLGNEDWARYYRIKQHEYAKKFNRNIKDEKQQRFVSPVIFLNARKSDKSIITLQKCLRKLAVRAMEKRSRYGLDARPIRIILVGMPNVGKSALANRLLGRRKATCYDFPGTTRSISWLKLRPEERTEAVYKTFDIIDTPGVLPPNLYKAVKRETKNDMFARLYLGTANENSGSNKARRKKHGLDAEFDILDGNVWLLAAANQIMHGIYDVDSAAEKLLCQIFRVAQLNSDYACLDILRHRYKLDPDEFIGDDCGLGAESYLNEMGIKFGHINNAAMRILTDFRKGYLGRMTLQTPPWQRLVSNC